MADPALGSPLMLPQDDEAELLSLAEGILSTISKRIAQGGDVRQTVAEVLSAVFLDSADDSVVDDIDAERRADHVARFLSLDAEAFERLVQQIIEMLRDSDPPPP